MIIPLNFPTFIFFRAQPTNQAICYMICPWPLEGVPCAMTTGLNQCAGASRYAASAQRGLPAIGGRQEKAGSGMVGSWKFWDILKWKELHLRSQFHRVFTLLHFLHCGSFWIVLVRLASILSMHVCILACCRAPLPSWWVYLPILSVSSSRPSWISIAGHHASRPKLTGRLRSIYKPYAYIYIIHTAYQST